VRGQYGTGTIGVCALASPILLKSASKNGEVFTALSSSIGHNPVLFLTRLHDFCQLFC
jgi:hypothetical protein